MVDEIEIADVTVDTSEVDQALANVRNAAEETARDVLSIARKGVQLLGLFTAGSKSAIVQSTNMLAQATLIAAQTIFEISTAQTLTVFGAINATLGFAAAFSLAAKAVQIAQFGRSVEAQFEAIDTAINAGNIIFAGWQIL